MIYEPTDRPIAIDLCCGKGGWTLGLQAAGYKVFGFDIERYDYPGELVIQDVRTLEGRQFKKVALIVASPPCQQFSVHDMKMFHPDPPPPTLGVELFRACERIGRDSGVPFIIENVRGARKFVGKAQAHCGPFYFWGSAVPALFHPEHFTVQKGFHIGIDRATGIRQLGGGRQFSSHSKERKEWSAKVAMIPFEISKFIGEVWR